MNIEDNDIMNEIIDDELDLINNEVEEDVVDDSKDEGGNEASQMEQIEENYSKSEVIEFFSKAQSYLVKNKLQRKYQNMIDSIKLDITDHHLKQPKKTLPLTKYFAKSTNNEK